jgi:hypothetical protein
MIITHTLSLDLMNPQTPQRIHAKQGDMGSRALEILLFSGGEPFPLAEDVNPILRWFACDPDTGKSASGICDTLPDGSHMFQICENQLIAVLPPQMLAQPGLVQADLLLVSPEKTLATFNFEFYVNPAVVTGSSPEAGSFYKLSSLDQINAAIAALQTWQTDTDRLIAHIEQEVFELKRIVNEM